MLAIKKLLRNNRLSAADATIDYYFRAALHDLITQHPYPERPIRRLGPYTFACNRRLVIIRYLTQAERDVIKAQNWLHIYYVVDDILPAIAASTDLPADYRRRLDRFAATMMQDILAMGPVILAPSKPILDLFPKHGRELIAPCALALCGSFPPSFWLEAPLRLAFFGTRSHNTSLGLIEEIAERLRERLPGARLTLFFGRHLPASLARLPNIDNRKALPWGEFRQLLSREPFHIGLAPLPDTPFARARSITKLLDHAAAGVAGLYSDAPPFAGAITHGRDGLLLPWDARVWVREIERLEGEREQLVGMARQGVGLARILGSPAQLRAFWLARLGIAV